MSPLSKKAVYKMYHKANEYIWYVPRHFLEENFGYLQFAFLHTKSLLKMSALKRKDLFTVGVNSFLLQYTSEGRQNQFVRVTYCESVSIILKL